ncbi:MAG: hypothetical protein RIK87_04455 [Fuerstiella sp.]
MNVAVDHSGCVASRRRRVPTAWIVLILFDVCLVALVCAQDDQPNRAVAEQTPVGTIVQIEGPADVEPDDVRFEAIDVFVDAGDESLAAYQFELQSRTPGVEIVGIEGGEHAAFAEPPYYDARAMNNNRVIIAAFNTGRNLPSGRSRVARIHVQLQGPGLKEYETKLTVSATVNGKRIPAEASISRTQA